MPKKKNYPKYFSAWSPPYKPQESLAPLKEYPENVNIKSIDLEGYSRYSKQDFLDSLNFDFDNVEVSIDRLDVQLHFTVNKLVKNKSYKHEMKQYEKDLEAHKVELLKYEEDLKEWNNLKDRWGKEQLEENTKLEKKLLKELQKKYGENNAKS